MRKFFLWTLAFVITVSAAIYQRHTGPTYPKDLNISVNNKPYNLKLIRSIALDEKSEVRLNITDSTIKAKLFFKRFNSNEEYQTSDLQIQHQNQKKKVLLPMFLSSQRQVNSSIILKYLIPGDLRHILKILQSLSGLKEVFPSIFCFLIFCSCLWQCYSQHLQD